MRSAALVMLLRFLVVVFFQLWRAAVVAQSSADCSSACGDIKIPYPFGLEHQPALPPCPEAYDTFFCDTAFNPPRLIMNGDTEVINVSYAGQMTVLSPVAFECYNKHGERISQSRPTVFPHSAALKEMSDTENTFTTLGCDTTSVVSRSGAATGCNMVCDPLQSVIDGSCSGIGCCQTAVPKSGDYGDVNITLGSFHNHTKVNHFNPCSYAFVAQSSWSWFNFSNLKSYLTNFTTPYLRNNTYYVPVVWDWIVGPGGCDEYTCPGGENKSKCVIAKDFNINYYNCICSDGYQGNPYIEEVYGGCSDVNECKLSNNCSENAICKNEIGSYSCHCRWGYSGNGWKSRTSLYGKSQHGQSECIRNFVPIIAGVTAAIIALPIIIWFLYWAKKERQRMKCFQENGGRLLKQKIDSHKEVKENFKIFRHAQLKNATDNFNERKKLPLQNDQDFCEVFRGSGTNNESGESSQMKAYTVKRYKEMEKDHIIQFVNEVDALSQINHPHVMKLLGCCLDTKYPMLVYEYVSEEGKTLSQYIDSGDLSWEDCKRIAAKIADALYYLVSVPMPPIFHGNFQSSDVLIQKDETSGKLVAKLCDFEASRLVPLYQAQYHQAQIKKRDEKRKDAGIEVTEKSVVYSFGLVIWELLTRKKEPVNLDSYLDGIPADAMKELEKVEQLVKLIKSCLQDQSQDRPTMKEVAEELRQVARGIRQGSPSSSSSSTTV